MSRQQFTSRNNIGQILTLQKSGTTPSFDPTIMFSVGSRRVSWRLNNGTTTTQTAGNTLTYTGFTSDTNIRTIEMRGNSFKNINLFDLSNDNLYGNINLSSLDKIANLTNFTLNDNINLTGITNPSSDATVVNYNLSDCNLTGNLDLTPLSGLGGDFQVYNNPNLTGITHNPSSRIFTSYYAYDCGLAGNLNLPLSGLGGDFQVYSNPNLTGITHNPSSQIFTSYYVFDCGLVGNLDLTPLSGLGGQVIIDINPNLTGITFPNSSNSFIDLTLDINNLIGVLDLTPLSGLSGSIDLNGNPLLTNVLLPNSIGDFSNNNILSIAFCNIDYINIKPLSGANFNTCVISLNDNNMISTDVNHILDDFSIMANNNQPLWSDIFLDIGGTNAPPDSSSGGYDGLASITFLTNPPYNWTITHS